MNASTRILRDGYRLLRTGLFRFDAEVIHERMIDALSAVPARTSAVEVDPVEVAGIRFPNRVGLAAGLDKDGLAARAWAHMGFGFAELGTVTASAQPGNEKPRIFRGPKSRAIVNRMGFNNAGAHELADRLLGYGIKRGNRAAGIPLGISIGKTKVVPIEESTDDYLRSLEFVAPVADYVAINVSSPNTPGLRSLQAAEEIGALLEALCTRAERLGEIPVFVKLAPDLEGEMLRETVAVIADSQVAGVIATNTTLSRDGLAPSDAHLADEAGGLSGAPLTRRALAFVEDLANRVDLPVIGVGGIMTPQDGHRMFDAGAQLLQLYTGFIYEGPALVRGIQEWGRR